MKRREGATRVAGLRTATGRDGALLRVVARGCRSREREGAKGPDGRRWPAASIVGEVDGGPDRESCGRRRHRRQRQRARERERAAAVGFESMLGAKICGAEVPAT